MKTLLVITRTPRTPWEPGDNCGEFRATIEPCSTLCHETIYEKIDAIVHRMNERAKVGVSYDFTIEDVPDESFDCSTIEAEVEDYEQHQFEFRGPPKICQQCGGDDWMNGKHKCLPNKVRGG
jgi:hypothetical protein